MSVQKCCDSLVWADGTDEEEIVGGGQEICAIPASFVAYSVGHKRGYYGNTIRIDSARHDCATAVLIGRNSVTRSRRCWLGESEDQRHGFRCPVEIAGTPKASRDSWSRADGIEGALGYQSLLCTAQSVIVEGDYQCGSPREM